MEDKQAELQRNVALVNETATATATAAQTPNGWEATMLQLFGGATEYRPPSGTFVVRAAAVYLAAAWFQFRRPQSAITRDHAQHYHAIGITCAPPARLSKPSCAYQYATLAHAV